LGGLLVGDGGGVRGVGAGASGVDVLLPVVVGLFLVGVVADDPIGCRRCAGRGDGGGSGAGVALYGGGRTRDRRR